MDFNEWVQLKKQVEEDLNRFFQSLQILERLVLELSEKESSVSTKDFEKLINETSQLSSSISTNIRNLKLLSKNQTLEEQSSYENLDRKFQNCGERFQVVQKNESSIESQVLLNDEKIELIESLFETATDHCSQLFHLVANTKMTPSSLSEIKELKKSNAIISEKLTFELEMLRQRGKLSKDDEQKLKGFESKAQDLKMTIDELEGLRVLVSRQSIDDRWCDATESTPLQPKEENEEICCCIIL